ncbi:ATP-dependent clp protease adaptor protein clpS domain-containing protein [Phthorimaea operculella]|nr:ATP-dependent clp protease adaptor protein clpS domain-containing protein [Phthorimaea operculella]
MCECNIDTTNTRWGSHRDTEAWKRDPFCELHAAPKDEEETQAAVGPDVIERMKIVASVCQSYCFRLLTHVDHSPGLPNDLRLKDNERDLLQILDQPDCYCTVLYNDETHTFEQVITTLTRVMKCNHRDSVELVSLIDREGRAMVKCNSFQVCDKLKTDIESCTAMFARFTSRHGPGLKVLVMHAHLVAHQTFAMKLLNWLQNFVSQEPVLRLANDFRMWKAARTAWHRLLIATTLMDYTTKKQMAVLFTKNYGVMQNDFRMWKAARTAWHRLLIATTLMDYTTKKQMAVLFTKNYERLPHVESGKNRLAQAAHCYHTDGLHHQETDGCAVY